VFVGLEIVRYAQKNVTVVGYPLWEMRLELEVWVREPSLFLRRGTDICLD
jgi:hypothetical protein